MMPSWIGRGTVPVRLPERHPNGKSFCCQSFCPRSWSLPTSSVRSDIEFNAFDPCGASDEEYGASTGLDRVLRTVSSTKMALLTELLANRASAARCRLRQTFFRLARNAFSWQ